MFETFTKPDTDRCHFCKADHDLMVFDGHGYGPEPLDDPGTIVMACNGCRAAAYRALLAALADVT